MFILLNNAVSCIRWDLHVEVCCYPKRSRWLKTAYAASSDLAQRNFCCSGHMRGASAIRSRLPKSPTCFIADIGPPCNV